MIILMERDISVNNTENRVVWNSGEDRKEVLFQEIAEKWLQMAKIRTKESTFARYTAILRIHILPLLGHFPISDISLNELERFSYTLLQNGRIDGKGGLSPKTVSDIVVVVKSVFSYAKEHEIPIACRYERIKINCKCKEMRILSKDERTKLIHALLDCQDPCGLGILISLFTGMRLGEVCALRWGDIDFDQSVIYVRTTMQRIQDTNKCRNRRTKIVITEPKSRKSNRVIPIPKCIEEILKHAQLQKDCFILSGSPNQFVEPRKLQYHFAKLQKEIGMQGINYHSLRHSFATNCMELGFDPKSLSEILGHSNVSITLNRYVHSQMELKRNNMNLLTIEEQKNE